MLIILYILTALVVISIISVVLGGPDRMIHAISMWTAVAFYLVLTPVDESLIPTTTIISTDYALYIGIAEYLIASLVIGYLIRDAKPEVS